MNNPEEDGQETTSFISPTQTKPEKKTTEPMFDNTELTPQELSPPGIVLFNTLLQAIENKSTTFPLLGKDGSPEEIPMLLAIYRQPRLNKQQKESLAHTFLVDQVVIQQKTYPEIAAEIGLTLTENPDQNEIRQFYQDLESIGNPIAQRDLFTYLTQQIQDGIFELGPEASFFLPPNMAIRPDNILELILSPETFDTNYENRTFQLACYCIENMFAYGEHEKVQAALANTQLFKPLENEWVNPQTSKINKRLVHMAETLKTKYKDSLNQHNKLFPQSKTAMHANHGTPANNPFDSQETTLPPHIAQQVSGVSPSAPQDIASEIPTISKNNLEDRRRFIKLAALGALAIAATTGGGIAAYHSFSNRTNKPVVAATESPTSPPQPEHKTPTATPPTPKTTKTPSSQVSDSLDLPIEKKETKPEIKEKEIRSITLPIVIKEKKSFGSDHVTYLVDIGDTKALLQKQPWFQNQGWKATTKMMPKALILTRKDGKTIELPAKYNFTEQELATKQIAIELK